MCYLPTVVDPRITKWDWKQMDWVNLKMYVSDLEQIARKQWSILGYWGRIHTDGFQLSMLSLLIHFEWSDIMCCQTECWIPCFVLLPLIEIQHKQMLQHGK